MYTSDRDLNDCANLSLRSAEEEEEGKGRAKLLFYSCSTMMSWRFLNQDQL
jgi:hypothetical protein